MKGIPGSAIDETSLLDRRNHYDPPEAALLPSRRSICSTDEVCRLGLEWKVLKSTELLELLQNGACLSRASIPSQSFCHAASVCIVGGPRYSDWGSKGFMNRADLYLIRPVSTIGAITLSTFESTMESDAAYNTEQAVSHTEHQSAAVDRPREQL